MGNHRFRLANVMPNAWFFKLKDMNKSKPNKPNTNSTRAHPRTHAPHNPSPAHITPSRASYYFPSTPKALDTQKPTQRPRQKAPSLRPIFSTSSSCSRNSTSESDSSTFSHCKIASSADDIIFDVSELPPPIVTTTTTKKKENKEQEQQEIGGNAANTAARLRVPLASSPRLGLTKKVRAVQRVKVQQQQQQRRSLWESMAVVKSSSDPRRDFRESMREMIRENNLRASKDLEELLACYLSLNSDEYHGVIVRAFEEIWFDVSERV